MADQIASEFPKTLVVRMEGERNGLNITAQANVMTDDGKINRDVVLRLGRVTDTPDFYEYQIDGDKVVARAVKSEESWTVTYPEFEGKKNVSRTVERTNTKTASRSKKTGVRKIDPGSDLQKVTAFIAGELFPAVKTSGRSSSDSATRQTQNRKIAVLLQQLAEARGVSVDVIAEEMEVDLSKLGIESTAKKAKEAKK